MEWMKSEEVEGWVADWFALVFMRKRVRSFGWVDFFYGIFEFIDEDG